MIIVDYRMHRDQESYLIKVKNNSTKQFYFICYQNVPSNSPNYTYPLAWFAMPLATSTSGYFTWQKTYELIWADTGMLEPGKIVRPGQILAAELNEQNKTTLKNNLGAYHFSPITDGTEGKLTIDIDGGIPNGSVSAGIGMGHNPTAATQASPNDSLVFTPEDPQTYMLAFSSTKIQKGQVLETSSMARHSCEIKFPVNQFGAVAELQEDNSWAVTYKPFLSL